MNLGLDFRKVDSRCTKTVERSFTTKPLPPE